MVPILMVLAPFIQYIQKYSVRFIVKLKFRKSYIS